MSKIWKAQDWWRQQQQQQQQQQQKVIYLYTVKISVENGEK